METHVESIEHQILSVLLESYPDGKTSSEIARRIDANVSQVEGTLRKKLIPRESCEETKKEHSSVYCLTAGGYSSLQPPTLQSPSPPKTATPQNLRQETILPMQSNANIAYTVPGMENYPMPSPYYYGHPPFPPPQQPVRSIVYHREPSLNWMSQVSHGVYYTPTSAAANPSFQFPQSTYAASQYSAQSTKQPKPPVRKSVLKLTSKERKDTELRKAPEEERVIEETVQEVPNTSENVWDFLLNATREIRIQGKTINAVMAGPYSQGKLTTTMYSTQKINDKPFLKQSLITDQIKNPLKCLASMGPAPSSLDLSEKSQSYKNENQRDVASQDESSLEDIHESEEL